ncbi:serine hydrolase domain-containing protein [Nonomuraea sp. NPDC050310]|uniref:serine hydrolase domain-containing protein n=1 Tax=unclassified Nonomuraea TaxID=2593643 RepID=UPI0033C82232
MKYRAPVVIALLAGCVLALTAGCTAAPAPKAGPPPVASSIPPAPPVRAEAEGLVAAGSPGAVTYVLDGDRVWQAAAGEAEPGSPMRTDHRFRIASITKTFTAALIARQVRSGRLKLTDRARDLLPKATTSRATVADLLKHTSGIPDYLRGDRFTEAVARGNRHLDEWPPAKLVAYAGEPGPPGVYRYSNTNYILLGLVLEKLGRRPYRAQIADLALPDTELPAVPFPDRLARGVHTDGSPGSTEASASLFWSAGGLVSTVADVARFYRALFSGELPEGALVREKNGVYGERLSCGVHVLTHSGLLHGYGGAAMSTEDGSRVVVVEVNSSNAGDAIAAASRLMCAT